MNIRRQVWLILAAALTIASGCKKTSAPDDNVWAVVDGTPITRAEVDKYYRTQLNPDAPAPSQDEALSLRLNVLDELINNHILLEKAKALGVPLVQIVGELVSDIQMLTIEHDLHTIEAAALIAP